MNCRATECPEKAVTSGLCEKHYLDWRTTIDQHKNAKQIKNRIEKDTLLKVAPMVTRLGEFK